MPKISTGRVLLTLAALATMSLAYVADWNETHIYNPDWTSHAKFHNAQTMSVGAALGLVGLYALWMGRGAWSHSRLQLATGAASLYWITQLSAIFYPGTALVDPPGTFAPQPALAGAILALNTLAYVLESRRIGHDAGQRRRKTAHLGAAGTSSN
ncbi:acetyltransferase [Streptomyces sp. NBC_01142]|uniref:DUF6640 family protein n=1 Tax=Streptomyces sp. NBC_01142 TaxID=2975865 RepID=UPI00224E9CFF|nr:DUF6640 family protein [Streptomyces sp. NBC_01142]MCX4825220.1 acetyltransferase [Streptomyces sp. NBC_01142]